MADPANRVSIKNISLTDGKVSEMTIEELDAEGVLVAEENIPAQA